MDKIILKFITVFLIICSILLADNGLITVKSSHSVKATADSLENIFMRKDLTVFNRINHAENAKIVDKKLRPTILIIFGNPNIGTPLMQNSQSIAIDLPQKAIIWEDEDGQVWLTYNDPKYLAKRHNIPVEKEFIQKVEKVLSDFTGMAAGN